MFDDTAFDRAAFFDQAFNFDDAGTPDPGTALWYIW